LNPGFSVQLDLLRWIAALAVFISHFSYLGIAGVAGEPLTSFGRVGVIVFFVLSGYVIAYVAHERHSDIDDYALARVARLYSVYLPALALTVVLDLYGRNLDAAIYGAYPAPALFNALKKLPVFLSFMQENALFSSRWFSNGPLWSIAYEFWYYVVYAIAFYTRGIRRIIFIALCAFMAGWKILLLLPIWLAGAMIYHNRNRIKSAVPSAARTLLLVGSIGMVAVASPRVYSSLEGLRIFGMELTGGGFQAFFISDYVCAIPMTLLLAGLVSSERGAYPKWLAAPIRLLAGFSFSLYVFHVPVILFARAAGLYDPEVTWQSLLAAGAIVLTIYLLSLVSEQKKAVWYAFLDHRYRALMVR
jgi:peptidoglycan/LPS O-acetylase OafA/YrhL